MTDFYHDYTAYGTARFKKPLYASDLVVALLVAASAYLLHTLLTGGFTASIGNFTKYPSAVGNFLAGTLDRDRALDYSPLYLRLSIWAEMTFSEPIAALTKIQLAFTGCAAGLLYLTVRRRAGISVSLAAAALLALYPGLLAYAWVFEPEALLLFTLCLTVFFADSPDRTLRAASGFALALAALARPSVLPLALIIPAAWLVQDTSRRSWAGVAAFATVAVGSWLLLSAALAPGGVSLTAMNPGTVVYDGANPLSFGATAEYPDLVGVLQADHPEEKDGAHLFYRTIAKASEGRELTRGEVNGWWAGKALAYMAANPLETARRWGRKLYYSLDTFRWHDLRIAYLADRELSSRALPLVPFGALAALALTGSWLRREKWRGELLLYGGAAMQLALMMLTYTSERQRLLLLPFLCILAALGIKELVRAAKKINAVALFVGLTFLLTIPTPSARSEAENLANLAGFVEKQRNAGFLAGEGEKELYLKAQAAMLAYSPYSALPGARPANLQYSARELAKMALEELKTLRQPTEGARLDEAVLHLAAGDTGSAEKLLLILKDSGAAFVGRRGRVPSVSYYLGLAAALRGDRAGGAARMEEAWRAQPGDARIGAALFVLSGDVKIADALSRWYSPLDADNYIGMAALALGEPKLAVERLGRVAAALPGAREVKLPLAAALADAGQDEKACAVWMEAMKIRSTPLAWEEKIIPAFDRWAAGRGPGEFPRFVRAKVLRQFGRFAQAREELIILRDATGRDEVARELAAVENDLAAQKTP